MLYLFVQTRQSLNLFPYLALDKEPCNYRIPFAKPSLKHSYNIEMWSFRQCIVFGMIFASGVSSIEFEYPGNQCLTNSYRGVDWI